MKLVLIRGIPGSGKTTEAMKFVKAGFAHCEADHFFETPNGYEFDPQKIAEAHRHCQDTASMLLRVGRDVVVSNTFSRLWEMAPYVQMADRYGAELEVIEMTGRFQNVHGVPDEAIQRMIDRWEKIA